MNSRFGTVKFQQPPTEWEVSVVLGLQYGDEAKGKVVESLVENILDYKLTKEILYDSSKYNYKYNRSSLKLEDNQVVCIRFCGGANAGHTLDIDEEIVKTNMLPSAIIFPNVICLIDDECYPNFEMLEKEITNLELKYGMNDIRERLWIGKRAHVVTQEHIQRDINKELERSKTGTSIGTCKMGIGECASDKYARDGIRVESVKEFEKLGRVVDMLEFYRVNQSVKLEMIFEGAQSTGLDITYGDYNMVTSSRTHSPSILYGKNQNFKSSTLIAVVKMYNTYVGSKKFQPICPSTESNVFEKIVDVGHEFGTVTKRRRQINHTDLFQIKEGILTNNLKDGNVLLVFNKGDVLEEVFRMGYENAFSLIVDGKVETFDSLEKMEDFILDYFEREINLPPENIRFSKTPKSDPSIWHTQYHS